MARTPSDQTTRGLRADFQSNFLRRNAGVGEQFAFDFDTLLFIYLRDYVTAVDTRCTISLFFARSERVGPSFVFDAARTDGEHATAAILPARAESRIHPVVLPRGDSSFVFRPHSSADVGNFVIFFLHSCVHGKRRYRRLSR